MPPYTRLGREYGTSVSPLPRRCSVLAISRPLLHSPFSRPRSQRFSGRRSATAPSCRRLSRVSPAPVRRRPVGSSRPPSPGRSCLAPCPGTSTGSPVPAGGRCRAPSTGAAPPPGCTDCPRCPTRVDGTRAPSCVGTPRRHRAADRAGRAPRSPAPASPSAAARTRPADDCLRTVRTGSGTAAQRGHGGRTGSGTAGPRRTDRERYSGTAGPQRSTEAEPTVCVICLK